VDLSGPTSKEKDGRGRKGRRRGREEGEGVDIARPDL